MRTALALFASLVALASPCLAATFQYEGHTVTIEPGKAYEQEVTCKTGSLVSGGYDLGNVNRGKGRLSSIIVVQNGPIADDTWRVAFFNDGDAPALVDFRVALLCD